MYYPQTVLALVSGGPTTQCDKEEVPHAPSNRPKPCLNWRANVSEKCFFVKRYGPKKPKMARNTKTRSDGLAWRGMTRRRRHDRCTKPSKRALWANL